MFRVATADRVAIIGRIGLTQGDTKDLPDDVGRATGDEHDEYLPSSSPDEWAFGKFADDGTDDAGSHHTEHKRRDGRCCAGANEPWDQGQQCTNDE